MHSLRERFSQWKEEFRSHTHLIYLSILFFITANVINFFAGRYADRMGSAAVSDLILDNIPSINLNFLDTYGYTFIILLLFIYPLFYKVKELHIVLSQFSLLLLVRSIFITLTHLKMPAEAIITTVPKIYEYLTFQNDEFFSGHVAFAFLGFLLFRKEKIGIFFLIATLVMAATVLFMHVHYSIDVFSAPFIAYATYRIGEWLFKKVNNY